MTHLHLKMWKKQFLEDRRFTWSWSYIFQIWIWRAHTWFWKRKKTRALPSEKVLLICLSPKLEARASPIHYHWKIANQCDSILANQWQFSCLIPNFQPQLLLSCCFLSWTKCPALKNFHGQLIKNGDALTIGRRVPSSTFF